jgi:uncharacterized membrane protein
MGTEVGRRSVTAGVDEMIAGSPGRDERAGPAPGLARQRPAVAVVSARRRHRPWSGHPGVRSGTELTRGERAADQLRNGMGSWTFVLAALLFLGVWMGLNRADGFDPYPFILLNLVLSCLAALQGAILLIAAKRSDQIASELARHDYEADTRTRDVVEALAGEVAALRAEQAALHELLAVGRPSESPKPASDEPLRGVAAVSGVERTRRG